MDTKAPTLAEAVHTYTASLKTQDQSVANRELNRFLRWFEAQRPGERVYIGDLKISDVVAYAESATNVAGGMAERLQPVKAFLAYAHKQGWTEAALAPHVRIRKTPTLKKQQAEVQPRSVVQLTESGYHALVAELEELRGRVPAITEEIQKAAADKDFRENAPLQAAREEQAKLASRIQELEGVLRSAEIMDERAADERNGRVTLGSTVVVHDLSHDEELRYTLVAGREVDIRSGKLSVDSPIGRALLDRGEGDEVEVQAPVGEIRLRVQRIEA
jgi:transcription elongation factor GreA